MITNPRRLKQIKEFFDKDHKVMSKFYDLVDSDLSNERLKKEMKKLINEDPLFFDSYLILVDILFEEGKKKEAKKILRNAFQKAMEQIVDKEGRWPKIMRWGWLENRHIIRTINRWTLELWWDEKIDEALSIFRGLLKSNPNDNIGARFSILAIKMGLNPDYEEQFSTKMPGFIDGFKISKWFDKNSEKFPGEFDWWWKEVEKEFEK